MTLLHEWLAGAGPSLEDGRRAWVQRSISPGLFLAVLEEGPLGHGTKTFYGKADTPEAALRVAVQAWGVGLQIPGAWGGELWTDRL